MKNKLLVILGPTAIGKTKLAIDIAKTFDAEIISADSRQFYKELKIGVAAPTDEELKVVKHHFVGNLSINEYYNVSKFENEVLEFLNGYFQNKRYAVMASGSGLYIDAVCKGIDELPDPDDNLRRQLKKTLKNNGLESLLKQLEQLDPEYYKIVDLNNPNRIMRALEVCLKTGKTYTSLRNNKPKKRDFEIIKIGLNRPREELFEIIENRVDKMIEQGLPDEVKGLWKYKNLNALNTVGYKEIFDYFDGNCTHDQAIEKIKTNTRRYAKRQLTWFKKDKSIHWFHPDEKEKIVEFVKNSL
ncbi:MAG: tRNA (adenosine(37)-N6)-dimethylallyltransferase MiaA [Bacteroidetes bacterium]|nr:tRNA (adenosine(37)-N6)-dimethylallyltransferase MiaA [Bacteroidota bacterium]MBL7105742.1 tRNA (adenosine(37)-N6)-dimethylallyltransferase MiaA [Bacteroidales bacterium]